MELYKFLDKDICTINIDAKNKEEVLKKLGEIADKSEQLQAVDSSYITKMLKDREGQGSTGFGGEIAIPHARIKGLEEILLFVATSDRGIDFDSIDKKKVRIFFVLLAPETMINEHLKVLAAISRLLATPNFKKELQAARTADAIYETFLRTTQQDEKKAPAVQKMKLMHVFLFYQELIYDILEFFIQKGVEGATVVDSFGMGEYISNIPLFASFIGFLQENKNQSKTIITLIPAEMEADLIKGIEQITGDLDKKQGAMVITQDVSFYKGTMKMM